MALARTLKNGAMARPALMDRIGLWMSTMRDIDGLWVGASTNQDEPALRRVEDALQLMKQQSPLHYSRVIRCLDRIWINLAAGARGNYSRQLNACVLDERFVLDEQTTPDQIASVIVHEATHAVLDRRGITYDELQRHRIEAICLRRQLHFVSGLAGCEAEKESVRASLDYYSNNPEFFSDANMQQRFHDGSVETLRWLGVPNWLVALISNVASLRRRWNSWSRVTPSPGGAREGTNGSGAPRAVRDPSAPSTDTC
jgi:hypothetical protein